MLSPEKDMDYSEPVDASRSVADAYNYRTEKMRRKVPKLP
jgi:hypothetical protein